MVQVARDILIACLAALTVQNAISQPKPIVTVSVESVDFQSQKVGAAGTPKSLILTNASSAPIEIRNILISGIDFSQSNTCPQRLPSGKTCLVEITFKPVVTGPRLGALQLACSGSDQTRTIPLSGTGE